MGTRTGTGDGTVTGTVMWMRTDTRTGTSLTLIYFNSNSIYTKNKKTSLGSSPPPRRISKYYGNEKVKKAASLISKATALQVHRALCQFLHRLCTTTTWNDQILSFLENLNGKAINFIVFVWVRTRSSLFSFSFIFQPLKDWTIWN